jgi:hypothetical protein
MPYDMFRPTRWSGRVWQQRHKAAMRRSTVCTTTLNRGSLPLRIRKIAPLADYRLAVAVRTQQNSDESNRIVSSLRKYQNENC